MAQYDYTFQRTGPKFIAVGISPDHCGRYLDMLCELATRLRKHIPFRFKTWRGMQFSVLKSNLKHNGPVQVWFEIEPIAMRFEDAASLLMAKGFTEGFKDSAV